MLTALRSDQMEVDKIDFPPRPTQMQPQQMAVSETVMSVQSEPNSVAFLLMVQQEPALSCEKQKVQYSVFSTEALKFLVSQHLWEPAHNWYTCKTG